MWLNDSSLKDCYHLRFAASSLKEVSVVVGRGEWCWKDLGVNFVASADIAVCLLSLK